MTTVVEKRRDAGLYQQIIFDWLKLDRGRGSKARAARHTPGAGTAKLKDGNRPRKRLDESAALPTAHLSLAMHTSFVKVAVSFEDKTATVTYDEGRTDVKALTAATTNAGYTSAPKT
jgi:hypothetical protein